MGKAGGMALCAARRERAPDPIALDLMKMLRCPPASGRTSGSQHRRRLREFLAGEDNGEDLLHALYDYVLDEPVPERLSAILRR